MGREEFTAKTEEINRLAAQYERDRGNLQLRERIWLLMWEIRGGLFRGAKTVCGYLRYPPSGLYESGEEFLTEVFLDTVPRLLNTYRRGREGEGAAVHTFLQYFNHCFPQDVKKALADLQNEYGYLVVRAPSVPVFQEAREDSILPDARLNRDMERRIIGRVSTGAGAWIKTELRRHGRIVFVREADVEVHEGVSFSDIENEPDLPSPGRPGDRLNAEETYEAYILNLLTLIQRLYEDAGGWKKSRSAKRGCFRLLYTEKLMDSLKRVYDVRGDVRSRHERDSLSAAETGFMDYLLTGLCRDFPSIAATPYRACRDFPYLRQDRDEEIQPPFPTAVYAQFLAAEEKLNLAFDSFKVSFSNTRRQFNEQYDLLCRRKMP